MSYAFDVTARVWAKLQMKRILLILAVLACSACAAPTPLLLRPGQEIVIESSPSRFDEAGTRKPQRAISVYLRDL